MSYYVLALIILTGILMLLGIIWFIVYTLYVLHQLRDITGTWDGFDGRNNIHKINTRIDYKSASIDDLNKCFISIRTQFNLLQDYLKIEYKEYPKSAKFVKKVK